MSTTTSAAGADIVGAATARRQTAWGLAIATGILLALFANQRHGTGTVGTLFGPICALWFIALAVGGLWNIAKVPAILEALNPFTRCSSRPNKRRVVPRVGVGVAAAATVIASQATSSDATRNGVCHTATASVYATREIVTRARFERAETSSTR